MRDVHFGEHVHLLFGGAHEEEAGGVEELCRQSSVVIQREMQVFKLGKMWVIDLKRRGQTHKRGQELKAVVVLSIPRIHAVPVPQHEAYLHDPRRSSCHQRVPKHCMHHRAQWQILWMRTHRPASHDNHDGREQIPSGSSIPLSRKPYPHQSRTPPHDPHARMLQIVLDPRSTPPVLGERVYASPRGDEQAVKELLAPPCPPQPRLPNQQQNRQDNPIPNERTPHDKVRQALSQMIPSTEPKRRDAAKQHLHPAQHGHELTHDAMHVHHEVSNPRVDTLFEVQFQVNAHDDLRGEHHHEGDGEGAVDVGGELAPFVRVAEEVAEDGEGDAEGLEGDVEARAGDL